nr:PREDICTED: melanotransferrin [Macaca fascicularis]
MRGPSRALWLLLALRTVLGGMEVRWCVTSDPEQQKCSNMSTAFREAGIQPSLLCVQGTSPDHCIQLIAAQEADAITLDGGAIYEAGKEHGLKPVVGEVYDQEVGTSYYAVAVVKRSSQVTINTLKGVKSCHTGINRTVGWNVPVGYLVESGRLSVMGCDVLKAVSDYFGGSCVPGAGETRYSESLCRLCRGDSSGEGVCDKSPLERYYDYSGAFRCLAEGAGDVAFVKHSTVLENTDGKTLPSWGQALLSQDFELLCRDGSRADVTEWRQCHLARVPAHAVVVRADTDGGLIFRLLNEGQRLFSHEGSSFQMFSSKAYGQKDLLFKDSTSELVPIATQTYEAWLGQEYLHAMKGLLCDPNRLPPYLRWCVLSTPEIQKCGDMAVAFGRQQLKPEIQCVSAKSPQHCMEQIQAGQIDTVTLSGEDIYTAGKTYGLAPAAGEGYASEDSSNSYFVVAVVRRDSSHAFTLDELRGKRSCHAGFGSPAGWDIPVGALIRRGFIRPKDCDVLTAVSEFFNASCVPVNNPKNYPSSLCALCVGDEQGRNKCVGNSQERYYGNSGAFRCLVENAGDVAFVRHTTVFDNTNGHNSEPWAAELRSEDYELLCPNGARAEVSQFAACNLAQMPPHAVMVRPDTNIFTVYGLLDKAQDLFGDDHNKNGFKMFDSSNYHGQDLLFKDATVRAVPVGEKTTYRDWLGLDYVAALEGMLSEQCSGAGRAGPPRRLPGAVQTPLPQNLEGAGRGCCGSGEAGGGRFTAVRSRRGAGPPPPRSPAPPSARPPGDAVATEAPTSGGCSQALQGGPAPAPTGPARGTAASAGGGGREAEPGRRGETRRGPLEEGTLSRVGAPVPPTAHALGGRPAPGTLCPASSPTVAAPAPARASRPRIPLLSLLRLSPPAPPWMPTARTHARAAPSLKGAGGEPPEGLGVGTRHSSGSERGWGVSSGSSLGPAPTGPGTAHAPFPPLREAAERAWPGPLSTPFCQLSEKPKKVSRTASP